MFEWKNIFRGMAMGVSDLIPGVSGGTIALVLGIYHRLIAAINNLFSKNWKEQLGFLVPLGIGMGLAIFSLSTLLTWLLEDYPQPTFFFFIGLILGTIPFLLKAADYKHSFQPYHYLILIVAAILIIASGLVREEGTEAAITSLTMSDYVFLFFAAWLASSAMILPGVSGSFILLLLGTYETVITAVSSFNLPVLFVVGSGVLVGISVMSKFLLYLLRFHRTGTYAVMCGLLVGSIFVIFPGVEGNLPLLIVSFLTLGAGFFIAVILGNVERQ